ncbi:MULTISPECIES: hypothetical protein [Pseudomonas]|uniref:Uncharacterized protein n=2 Tax=Pseudomonas chlororaphis group TaxID=136842 RepID=A0A1H4M5J8_9PSED|nr:MULTISPECIES: hypothetical protein [Pseudomonas]RBJ82450.1 hypothetical protein C3L29_014400 [Pseudomonas sp. MWU12-2534b]MBK5542124.1 hypothetical protein [Pseudomonas sp. TH07]MBK5559702.1 hypothetical protein [Pseudomonas sp. TH05]MCE4057106.1 hypothetical protein [Pseudomonas sp. Au-Pse12]MDF2396081.1 hypothetical protein [Pseudomonas sp. 3MA1]
MTAQEHLVGGWTAYHKLTPKDQEVFKEALAGFVGVNYTPELVSTQVVNGTNYRYQTKATLPGSSSSWQAIVEIYAPINGKPHITQIHRI